MKRKVHIKAVKASIDELFSETIPRSKAKKSDKILPFSGVKKGVEFINKGIDTRDEIALERLAENRLERFMKQHKDNTKELYFETEINRVKDYQTYFPKYKSDPEQKQYYFALQRWIEFLENYSQRIYWYQNGNQVMTDWEFMQQTGMLDGMKQKGTTINPTHSFGLLKQTRLELFEKAKQNFLEERKMKRLTTSDFETSCMYYSWLKGELKTIENWLSDKYPNGKKKRKPSTSDQIEISKYKQYVNDEIVKAEKLLTAEQQKPEPFNELFEKALLFESIEQPKNEFDKAVMKSYYNYTFNNWLQQNKGWECGNKEQYSLLLTKENWKAFLLNEEEEAKEKKEKFELEKQSWQLKPKETETPPPNGKSKNRTEKVILDAIANMDKQGWQYAFVTEPDYNLFTNLLTKFFEYKPYELPETIIQLKRTCKTKVAKALGEIHKELSNENKLSTDTKYFQLIRVLSPFEKETERDLYKAITR